MNNPYRVIARKESDDVWSFSIGYVDFKLRKPVSWSAVPLFPIGETSAELYHDIHLMQLAFHLPILVQHGKKLTEFSGVPMILVTQTHLDEFMMNRR